MRRTLEQKQIIWNAIGYTPTALALPAHSSTARFVLIAGGIRGSKSLSAAREALPQACEPNQLGWILGPDYVQTRPEFSYLADDLAKLGLVAESWQPRQGGQALRTLTGTLIETKTTDDARKLASVAPDWIIVAEAAQCDFEIYYKCIERLAQKRGWLWLSGTFERAQGWYVDLFNRWQSDNNIGGRSFSLPSWSNTYAFPGGREDPEIKLAEGELPRDLFLERYGGIPCPPTGLVFPEFSFTKHVKPAPFWDNDANWRKFPVEVAVDPGFGESAYAVVAIQHAGDTVWVIDEIYERGMMVEQVIDLCKSREWWKYVKGGAGDYAIRQHQQAHQSTQELWQAKAGIYLRNQLVLIPAGINRTKTFLSHPGTGEPRMFFDPRCKHTAWEFSTGYRYREVREGQPTSDEPIDANNHSCKAIAYWLIDKFGATDIAPAPRQHREPSQNPFQMVIRKR